MERSRPTVMSTSGGSSETEVNELTVVPKGCGRAPVPGRGVERGHDGDAGHEAAQDRAIAVGIDRGGLGHGAQSTSVSRTATGGVAVPGADVGAAAGRSGA